MIHASQEGRQTSNPRFRQTSQHEADLLHKTCQRLRLQCASQTGLPSLQQHAAMMNQVNEASRTVQAVQPSSFSTYSSAPGRRMLLGATYWGGPEHHGRPCSCTDSPWIYRRGSGAGCLHPPEQRSSNNTPPCCCMCMSPWHHRTWKRRRLLALHPMEPPEYE